jgi:hypothetical protein
MTNLGKILAVSATGLAIAVAALAQSLPREAFKAKTYYIVNRTGKPAVENGADSEMNKWGRLTLADDADSADIKIVLTRAGASTTEKDTPKADGTGFDSTSSTTFTFGIDMHAYLKGQGLYFYQTNSASGGEKGGRNVIDNFRKLFPKNE